MQIIYTLLLRRGKKGKGTGGVTIKRSRADKLKHQPGRPMKTSWSKTLKKIDKQMMKILAAVNAERQRRLAWAKGGVADLAWNNDLGFSRSLWS